MRLIRRRFSMEDWLDALEACWQQGPPDGWFEFGSHVEFDGPMEFSTEVGEDGLPRWERHVETRGNDGSGSTNTGDCDPGRSAGSVAGSQ